MAVGPNPNPSAGGADQAAAAKPAGKDLKKKKDEKKDEDLVFGAKYQTRRNTLILANGKILTYSDYPCLMCSRMRIWR